MNWDAISAVGQLTGAIAVVVTLGYLAIQVRQNTLSNRVTAYQSWVDGSNSTNVFARDIYSFRDKARFNPENLSREEKDALDYYFVGCMNLLEAHFFFRQIGTIDEEYWQARLRTLKFVMQWPGFRVCWSEFRPMYDIRFATLVDSVIQEIDNGPEADQSGANET